MSQNKKIIYGREILKTFFKRGKLPSEEDFESLIESTFNKNDDELDINEENGLQLHAKNKGQLISFFDKSDEPPAWQFKFKENFDGIIFEKQDKRNAQTANDNFLERSLTDRSQIGEETNNSKKRDGFRKPAIFYISNEGDVGIGTDAPLQKLDVEGFIASKGRIGKYTGIIRADGEWHNIFEKNSLPDFSAFEIMAGARGTTKKEVKYALTHATAIGVRGSATSKITTTQRLSGETVE